MHGDIAYKYSIYIADGRSFAIPASGDLVPDVLPFGWFYLITPSFATALDRSLDCLYSFIWFDIPVKDKTSHAFQRNRGFQQRRCRSMGHNVVVMGMCPQVCEFSVF